jgi:hypothetical protein
MARATLAYDDVMHLMGYAKGPASDLEVLGYEKSKDGLRQFLNEAPDIGALLSGVILTDLKNLGIFPREFSSSRPEAYTAYVENAGPLYAVVEIDKPSVWTKSYFATPEEAATYLVGARVEASWLPRSRTRPRPVRVEHAP